MTALLATRQPSDRTTIRDHDLVRTPSGRIGAVVGVYRHNAKSVLVRFSPDECGAFLRSEVEPCRRVATEERRWIGWD
jgi:hypothetical protein